MRFAIILILFTLACNLHAKTENLEVTCSLISDGNYDADRFSFSNKGPIYASSKNAEKIKIHLPNNLFQKLNDSHLLHRFDVGFNFHLEIMREKKNGRLFYFFGENHIKRDNEKKLGKDFVDIFRIRMFEGVPEKEMATCFSKPMRLIAELYSNVGAITNFLFGIKGTTIKDALEDSQFVDCSDFDSISTRKGMKLAIRMECGKTFEPVAPVCKIGGNQDEEKKCNEWILKFRNERMIENIKTVATRLPANEPILIIVGSTHVTGTIDKPAPETYPGIPSMLASSGNYQLVSECWTE